MTVLRSPNIWIEVEQTRRRPDKTTLDARPREEDRAGRAMARAGRAIVADGPAELAQERLHHAVRQPGRRQVVEERLQGAGQLEKEVAMSEELGVNAAGERAGEDPPRARRLVLPPDPAGNSAGSSPPGFPVRRWVAHWTDAGTGSDVRAEFADAGTPGHLSPRIHSPALGSAHRQRAEPGAAREGLVDPAELVLKSPRADRLAVQPDSEGNRRAERRGPGRTRGSAVAARPAAAGGEPVVAPAREDILS